MKLKKLLCAFLAITMLMSTMGMMTFAEEASFDSAMENGIALAEEEIETIGEGTEEQGEGMVELYADVPTLYVSSDYNAETEGWGTTHFSNYSGAYAYATVNAKKSPIIIEKTTTVSGNCFDNNHKNYSYLSVAIQDGAVFGNASSKWDMTYKVTLEPGARLQSARGTGSSVGYSHIKNTLTVGAENAEKQAVIDFHKGTYQDMSIAVLYNGKLVANNALIKVADLGFTGSATINDSVIDIKGNVAFGLNNFYKQTMKNSTMTVKGHNITLEDKPTYFSPDESVFNNLTMDNSTIIVDDGVEDTTAEKVNLKALTMKNGSSMAIEEGTPISVTGKTTIENSTLMVGDVTIKSKGQMLVDNADLARRRAIGVNANEIHIEEGGTLKVDLVGGLNANKITGAGTLEIDVSDYVSGEQSTNLDLSAFTGKINLTNTNGKNLTVDVDENGIGVVVPAVAKIGDTLYSDFAEALKAIKSGDTLTLLENVTITDEWNVRADNFALTIKEPVTIDGNNKTIKFDCVIYDRGNNTCAFRTEADATFKNLTVDMSTATNTGNTTYMRAISTKANIVVDNCTFIGNPAVNNTTAIICGEGAGAAIENVTANINASTFIDWKYGVSDNRNDQDVKTFSVTDSTFQNAKALVSAKEQITFTGNTLKDSNLTIRSYSNKEGAKVTATGNTVEESGAVSGLTYEVHVIGEGVDVQEDIGTFVAAYGGEEEFSFEAALAKAEAAIAADPNADRDIKLFNNIADVNDDTLYKVPLVANENQVTVTFDFGGGYDAGRYISQTDIYNLGETISVPVGIEKDGFIFVGWDLIDDDKAEDGVSDTVDAQAFANATYKAIWFSEADYKFKTVLTPKGGIMLGERDMKVDPNASFLVEVSVADMTGKNMAWNDAEITLDYDNKVFKWNKIGAGIEEVDENTLRFKVYGSDRVDGKVFKQLSFTALNVGVDQNKFGAFTVAKATVDTGWAANTIDVTPVADKANATVYIFYSYNVTLGEGLEGAPIATTDADYNGKIVGYDNDYDYEVSGKCNGNDLVITYDDEGNFKVTKDQIKGDMTIEVKRLGVKGIGADDVEIYEYVAGVALVLVNAKSDRVYTYNGAIMYETPWYDTIASTHKHYGYLVTKSGFVADGTDHATALNTPDNKALALSKIGVTKTGDTRTNLTIDNSLAGDVNGTGKIDINDIQAAWNCYNGNDGAGVNANMPLYLRADICGVNAANRDKKVDSADVNAVVAMYDCQNNGGTVTRTDAVLADCGIEGNTYAITCTDKEGNSVEIVKSETGISAKDDRTALGHIYEGAFVGEGANMTYVLTCTDALCRSEVRVNVSDIFEDVKVANGQIYGTANVDNAEELMIFNMLDAEGKLLGAEGRSVVLNINANIDLSGYEWTALKSMFMVINGNGHTISNLSGVQGTSTGRGGFAGYLGGGTIRDLTLRNVTVNGSQVGAFVGAGEGAKLINCVLKGNVNIKWAQNNTGGAPEEWGAAGIVAGIATGGSYDVTIDKNADIHLDRTGRTTACDESESFTELNDYIQFVQGTVDCNITDNR